MTWDSVALSDVCEAPLKMDPASTGRERIRYVDIGSVVGRRHTLDDVPSIAAAGAPSRCRQVVHTGDTVFSTVRPYLEKIAYIDESLDGEFASTGFCVLRPTERLEPRYLYYFATSAALLDQVLPLQKGVSYPAVLDGEVRGARISLPPLDDQRRIVEILEDHLSRLEAARLELWRSRDTSLTALRMASLRTACSAPGTAYSIGDLATVRTGSTPLKSNRAYYEGGTVPWVTSGDLSQGLVASATSFVTELAVRERNLRVFPAGTLLVAMYGEGKTRGRCAELGIPATTNQACAAIELHDAELREWVRLALDSQYEQMRALASGGVQPNLNLSLVRGIEVVVPDPAVRSTAIGQVRAIEHARQQLGAAVDRQLLRAERLRRALLAAALSGRLTGHASDLDRAKELAAVEA